MNNIERIAFKQGNRIILLTGLILILDFIIKLFVHNESNSNDDASQKLAIFVFVCAAIIIGVLIAMRIVTNRKINKIGNKTLE